MKETLQPWYDPILTPVKKLLFDGVARVVLSRLGSIIYTKWNLRNGQVPDVYESLLNSYSDALLDKTAIISHVLPL